jgi:hypothetical protein
MDYLKSLKKLMINRFTRHALDMGLPVIMVPSMETQFVPFTSSGLEYVPQLSTDKRTTP